MSDDDYWQGRQDQQEIDQESWTSPENPLTAALKAHRYQSDRETDYTWESRPTACSCGATPDTRPDDDYEWWITHLKANI